MTRSETNVRVAVWQLPPGGRFPEAGLERLRSEAVELVVLPEYVWVRPEDGHAAAAAAHATEDLACLAALSREVDAVWVGGTFLERDGARLFNSCPVFEGGREIARYRKQRLMPGEVAAGLSPGAGPGVTTVRGIRIGLLICADVLDAATWAALAPLQPGIVAIPTHSPYRPDDTPEARETRDRTLFVAGAEVTGAIVLKACTVGGVFGRRAQGRSLIAGPGGIVARVDPAGDADERLLVADVPRSLPRKPSAPGVG